MLPAPRLPYGAISVHNSLADLRQDGAAATGASNRCLYNGSAKTLIEIMNEVPSLPIRYSNWSDRRRNRNGPRDLLQHGSCPGRSCPGCQINPDAEPVARVGRFRELTGTLEWHDGTANHTESQLINYRSRSRRNAGGHHLADLDWLPLDLIPGWSRTGGQRAGERLPRRNRRHGITNTLDAANGTPPITHGGANVNVAKGAFSEADQFATTLGGIVSPMASPSPTAATTATSLPARSALPGKTPPRSAGRLWGRGWVATNNGRLPFERGAGGLPAAACVTMPLAMFVVSGLSRRRDPHRL